MSKIEESKEKYTEYLGKVGSIEWKAPHSKYSLLVDVKVEQIDWSFGNTRLLVRPVAGEGSKWINADTITLKLIESHKNRKNAKDTKK
jgi:hypothetical protein